MYIEETIIDAEKKQRNKICEILIDDNFEKETKETKETQEKEMCTINIRDHTEFINDSSDDEGVWDRYEFV
jgi:hypothetical protein